MERVQGMKTLVMARISVQMAQMKILATAVSHLVPFAHNAVDYIQLYFCQQIIPLLPKRNRP